ncbi:hypothetical protein EES41_35175 [Streptomyces sp. ADI95-16]|uniref:hypothetical protein n=1 Tax=Streptomyces sp. ADI95-16 TaxID=1522758 RepID=UPI000F3A94BC|nr:hypothetical protein [Streptomyces sp. ADI95-16]AYV31996.1 hypothetical protein EES41_35175 [Streptomyces sp. ADI95-16]
MDIAARQLTAGLDPPSRADQLAAVQAIRRASQPAVDELHQAVTLHVFYAVAESCNTGHRPAVAELGALPDDARWLAGWPTTVCLRRRPSSAAPSPSTALT